MCWRFALHISVSFLRGAGLGSAGRDRGIASNVAGIGCIHEVGCVADPLGWRSGVRCGDYAAFPCAVLAPPFPKVLINLGRFTNPDQRQLLAGRNFTT